MTRRWLRPRLSLAVLCALLSGLLAAGPALAKPAVRLAQAAPAPVDPDDEDDTPAPPPPPVAAPAPAPLPPPTPAPPPAPPPGPTTTGGVVVYGPGYAVGVGTGYAPAPNPYGISPGELYARGASLRNVGMPLTVAAIVFFAIGIGLIVKGAEEATCATDDIDYNCSDMNRYLAWGVVSMLGSVVGLGVGIPLWAVGSYRMNRAVKMGFMPTFAQPYLSPTHNGATAGLRLALF
jgi:hypothetical protein